MSWPLADGIWLMGWYIGWWRVYRTGWVDVSTSLIVAGIHNIIVNGVLGSSYEILTMYFTMLPARFFSGWALLFLPGAVAAHEYPPVPRESVPFGIRVSAWSTPAVCGLIAVILIGTINYLLGR